MSSGAAPRVAWCEEGCPVNIEHIQRIVDMRRYDVMMEARFPQEVVNVFKGLENQFQPVESGL